MTTTETPPPIETHDTHSKRLIKHAEEQLAKGDRLQAAEKAWGAVAHRVKVIANKRGWKYDKHSHFFKVSAKITEETDQPALVEGLFETAENLHYNYYADVMPLSKLQSQIARIKQLLEILDSPTLLKPPPKTRKRWPGTKGRQLGKDIAKDIGGQGRAMGDTPKSQKRQSSAYGGKRTTQKMLDTGKR